MTKEIPFDDLPTWMRRSHQNVDWGIIIVALLSLLAAWPFFVQQGLPHTNATENYIYNASNYINTFSEGRLYSRWSDASLNGYGAPIPHYYPPGAPYTAALLHILFTNDVVIAVRLLYILIFLMAGIMTYVFVMRWAGAKAGILAATLYVYSPYFGMTAPHILGDLSGLLALALLPALLWAIHRLLTVKGPFDFTLVTLFSAALILTHIHSALISGLIASGFIIIIRPKRRKILSITLAFLAGGALASFYWIPLLFEQNAIQWQPATHKAAQFAITLNSLIKPLQRIDLREMVISPQFSLGITIQLFTVLGLIHVIRKPKNLHPYLYFFIAGISIVFLILIFLPESVWLLGPATLCFSISGAAVFHLQDYLPQQYQRVMLPVILISALLMAMPVWLAPYWPPVFGGTGIIDQIRYEQQGFGFAALPPHMDMPVTITYPLENDRSLINSYQTGNPLRIPQADVNEIKFISSSSYHDKYIIDTTETRTINILRANFRGWQATLDGEPIALRTDENTGLMQITLPPSDDKELHIYLGTTPVRHIAWWISGTTALILLFMIFWQTNSYDNQPLEYLTYIDVKEARLLGIALVGFMLIIYGFALPNSPYTLHKQPGHGLSQSIELRARTTVGLEALSYKMSDEKTYRTGETINFFIAWRTSLTLLENYHVSVILQDIAQNINWAQSVAHTPGNYPTRRWSTGDYIIDDYQFLIPETVRPGDYRLVVIVSECCTTQHRLLFFSKSGEVLGQTLPLPTRITVAD